MWSKGRLAPPYHEMEYRVTQVNHVARSTTDHDATETGQIDQEQKNGSTLFLKIEMPHSENSNFDMITEKRNLAYIGMRKKIEFFRLLLLCI